MNWSSALGNLNKLASKVSETVAPILEEALQEVPDEDDFGLFAKSNPVSFTQREQAGDEIQKDTIDTQEALVMEKNKLDIRDENIEEAKDEKADVPIEDKVPDTKVSPLQIKCDSLQNELVASQISLKKFLEMNKELEIKLKESKTIVRQNDLLRQELEALRSTVEENRTIESEFNATKRLLNETRTEVSSLLEELDQQQLTDSNEKEILGQRIKELESELLASKDNVPSNTEMIEEHTVLLNSVSSNEITNKLASTQSPSCIDLDVVVQLEAKVDETLKEISFFETQEVEARKLSEENQKLVMKLENDLRANKEQLERIPILENEIVTLKKNLDDNHNEKDQSLKLHNENLELTKALEELRSQADFNLSNYNIERTRLETEIKHLSHEIEKTLEKDAKYLSLERETSELRAKVEVLSQELESSEKLRQQSQVEETEISMKKLSELEESFNDLKVAKEALELQNQKLIAETEEMTSNHVALKEEHKKCLDDTLRLEKANDDLKIKLDTLALSSEELSTLEQNNRNLVQEMEETKQEYRALVEAVTSKNEMIEDLNKAVTELNDELDSKQTKNEELVVTNEELRRTVRKQLEQIDDYKTQITNVSGTSEALEEKEITIATIRSENLGLTATLSALAADLGVVKKQKATLESDVNSLNLALESLRNSLEEREAMHDRRVDEVVVREKNLLNEKEGLLGRLQMANSRLEKVTEVTAERDRLSEEVLKLREKLRQQLSDIPIGMLEQAGQQQTAPPEDAEHIEQHVKTVVLKKLLLQYFSNKQGRQKEILGLIANLLDLNNRERAALRIGNTTNAENSSFADLFTTFVENEM